ncbi:MAG: hypothetical protein M1840_005172 [Geoglossum simile]|nr:MAG: hypothetical protein M1840_005172 [Geoglossum simile]
MKLHDPLPMYVFRNAVHRNPFQAPREPPISNISTKSSYHSARTSSILSGPYHSAVADSASYVSAHSSLKISDPAPSSSVIDGQGMGAKFSGYLELVEERGLSLPIDQEVNWSGREAGMGQHVEFKPADELPLEVLHAIGSSLTAKVDKVRCRRILLARKSMKCTRKLKLEEVVKEVEHLQKLRHAHIIQLIGSYTQGKTFAILLYPAADCDLSIFMERTSQALSSDQLTIRDYLAVLSLGRFFRCLANALEFIHNNNIKHMDIKAPNILVNKSPKYICGHQVYIADFGISRSFSGLDCSQTDSVIARSPKYCAPEVYEGNKRGRSADIFSMGCVFSEMYSILCRRTLDDFTDHLQGDGDNGSFHANLPGVSKWVISCRESKPYLIPIDTDIGVSSMQFHDPAAVILEMIRLDPKNRPIAHTIAKSFVANTCCNVGPEDLTNESVSKPAKTLTPYTHQQYLNKRTLHYAIEQAIANDHQVVLEQLLEEYVTNPDYMHECGQVSCPKAAWSGNSAVVLRSREEDILGAALHKAAHYAREKAVELILEKGADTSTRDPQGKLALHLAAGNGSEAIVRLLIEKGADVNATSGVFPTASSHIGTWAKGCGRAGGGYEAVVPPLGGEVVYLKAEDQPEQTALHLAAYTGAEEVVKLLIENGAAVNTRDNWGRTPLLLAAGGRYGAVVSLPVKEATFSDAIYQVGETGPHTTAHIGVVKLLIENGATTYTKDGWGRTPLHIAASYGHKAVVSLLIKETANVGAKNIWGDTALHCAAYFGYEAVAALLAKDGTLLGVKNASGMTALDVASRNRHKTVVALLASQMADLEATDVTMVDPELSGSATPLG